MRVGLRPGRFVLGWHFLQNVIMLYGGFRVRVMVSGSSNRE